jgi:hypothetical protein
MTVNSTRATAPCTAKLPIPSIKRSGVAKIIP